MERWQATRRTSVEALRHVTWTRSNPAPEAVVELVLMAALEDGRPWTIREVAAYAGWGKTRAGRVIEEVHTFWSEWHQRDKNGTSAGHRRDKRGTPKRDQQRIVEASRDKRGTPAGQARDDRARDPYSTIHTTEQNKDQILFEDLQSRIAKVKVIRRPLSYPTYAKDMRRTLKAMKGLEGHPAEENLRTVCDLWVHGPNDWYRQHTPSKMMGMLLVADKAPRRVAEAWEWDAMGRPGPQEHDANLKPWERDEVADIRARAEADRVERDRKAAEDADRKRQQEERRRQWRERRGLAGGEQ